MVRKRNAAHSAVVRDAEVLHAALGKTVDCAITASYAEV
jgi:hypothetical protein